MSQIKVPKEYLDCKVMCLLPHEAQEHREDTTVVSAPALLDEYRIRGHFLRITDGTLAQQPEAWTECDAA